jgi:hypothetical protein
MARPIGPPCEERTQFATPKGGVMPVEIISKDSIPDRGFITMRSLPEWNEIEEAIKAGIPKDKVLSVKLTIPGRKDSNVNQQLIHLAKLTCHKYNRKYSIFRRKNVVYISPL